jgi:hypothetical protein
MKKWLIGIAGLFLLPAGVAALVGALLPVEHVAARTVEVGHGPEVVWGVLVDRRAYVEWRAEVVEVVLQGDGTAWCESYAGGERLCFVAVEETAPRRLVHRLVGEDLPFGGDWTFELEPAAPGCRMTIAERGRVYNPMYRFFARFALGHGNSIDRFLSDLEARLAQG